MFRAVDATQGVPFDGALERLRMAGALKLWRDYGPPEDRVRVYDTLSFTPIDWLDMPGPVTWLTIDDVENALVALVPSRRSIVFTHLTSKKPLGQVDVGDEPFQLLVEGERN